MISLVHPPEHMAALALWTQGAALKPMHRAAANLQLARADLWGMVEGGTLLAAIGFWELAPGFDEVFLAGRPALEIGPRMVPLTRLAHLTLLYRAQSGTSRFRALVRENHRPGERLARLSGFSLPSSCDGWGDAPAGFRIWGAVVSGHLKAVDLTRSSCERAACKSAGA